MAGTTLYTLNSLSEQVLRIIQNHRPTQENKLDKREIARYMRGVAAELLRGRWFEMKNAGETNALGHIYMAEFDDVEVKVDTKGVNYIDLPAIPESLPDETGIQNIQPATGKPEKDIPMVPIPMNARIVIQNLPVEGLQNRFGFEWRRNIVRFTEQQGERTLLKENIKKVRVDMITVGPEDVENDAPFPLPSDQFPTLLTKTLAIFGISVDEKALDLLNDNQ
jgi:hypothetical protein